ncbi:phytochrome B-like [Vigna unguiculata]|uniref:phytochrome B-like n=1 Tax=Vigna unguiculata TaxID=3917 RepID=UPI0010169F78|nr:phytochrome B-like [Vigna unguiculata]
MNCSVLSSVASPTILAHSSATPRIHPSTPNLNRHSVVTTTKSVTPSTQTATLHTVFHHPQPLRITTESVPQHQIPNIGFTQMFGSTIVVHPLSFRILAHSENTCKILGISPFDLCGADARSLFTRSSALLLQKAFKAREVSLTNPVLIQSRTSGEAFHGILHRTNAGIVVDLEPASWIENSGLSTFECGGSDVKLLCNSVVETVREMTGYDRVLMYKFHEDEHGEVVAERKRPDLKPYMGLHFPAGDIPEASRVSFLHNRVRMIVDRDSSPVRVVQDETLVEPVCLTKSTLRAPHGCHVEYMANMGCVGSLVISVVVDGGEGGMKLWGLLICHHASPKLLSFPLRSACESVVQAFGEGLKMEKQSPVEESSALCFR